MSTIETANAASTASKDIHEHVEDQETAIIELVMYENGKQITFDQVSGNEYQSITATLGAMLDVYDTDIYSSGEDDEKLFVKNVKYINQMGAGVGSGLRKYPLDEKISVKLSNWGVNEWGNVEFIFKLA